MCMYRALRSARHIEGTFKMLGIIVIIIIIISGGGGSINSSNSILTSGLF